MEHRHFLTSKSCMNGYFVPWLFEILLNFIVGYIMCKYHINIYKQRRTIFKYHSENLGIWQTSLVNCPGLELTGQTLEADCV